MAHSFIAYIDESGDDGLGGNYRVAGQRGGRSNWLTLSASLWRAGRDLEAVDWIREIQAQLPPQIQARALHCADLTHQQKVMAAQALADKPLRSICVMANKPTIPAGIYNQKNQLYFYMCRYLIERISWLCRDSRRSIREGDGLCRIVFSRRGKLNYGDFRDYLEHLKAADDPEIRINWPVIDIPAIEARDHATRAGLQVSDIIATCMTAGLEPDFYGNCERRYAEILKPCIYRRKGNFLSYGVKIVPRPDQIPLTEQQKAFVQLFEG